MYHTGLGVKQNSKEAVEWYRNAVEQGNRVGQNNLDVMYTSGDGSLPIDYLIRLTKVFFQI